MHTVILKNNLAVYVDLKVTDKGTLGKNFIDPTTTTGNTTTVQVDVLPKFWRGACFAWDGTGLVATDAYNDEILPEVRAWKTEEINKETSEAILAGFDYVFDEVTYHFSYDRDAQQNFSDTANVCHLGTQGLVDLPTPMVVYAYTADDKKERVALTLDVSKFMSLYASGALAHKANCLASGEVRKNQVAEATTLEGVLAV